MTSTLLRAGLGLALVTLAAAPALGASRFMADPYPSTYRAQPDAPVLIHNATVLTGTGQRLDNADVLLREGRIVAVGQQLQAEADVTRIDAQGKWVTPGLIDVH
jgi:hypothetical protein